MTTKHHGAAPARLKQLLLVLCVAQLMVILDISAVNVALPDLAKGLDINGSDIGWTVTSYSLIFGSLPFLGGRAADLIGRRRMFLAGLAMFTLASIGASVAVGGAGAAIGVLIGGTLTELVGWRSLSIAMPLH